MLIINEQVQSDFLSENVSESTVLGYFSTLSTLLSSWVIYSARSYVSSTDPDIPEDLPTTAVTEWNDCYIEYMTASNNTLVSNATLSALRQVYNLFEITNDAPLSRTNIEDQLTQMLPLYGNAEVSEFFASMVNG